MPRRPSLPTISTLIGLTASTVALALATRRLQRFEVTGHSMEPTLHDGSWLLVHRTTNVNAGDIVVAPHPTDPDITVIKRVALTGNGKTWLLGDNPDASTDSRQFGAVATDSIIGRVIWRYWPVRRVG